MKNGELWYLLYALCIQLYKKEESSVL